MISQKDDKNISIMYHLKQNNNLKINDDIKFDFESQIKQQELNVIIQRSRSVLNSDVKKTPDSDFKGLVSKDGVISIISPSYLKQKDDKTPINNTSEMAVQGYLRKGKCWPTSGLKRRRAYGYRQLYCSHCPFHTTIKLLLERHMRKHPRRKVYLCSICEKKFPQSSGLKIHIKRHLNQRDFPCNYCEYRAYTKMDRTRHMTIHTGERNQVCQFCGKAFAKDSTLREHVRSIHEREQKHICLECGFTTYRSNNLRVHIRMRHQGEYNNHVCPVCGARVKQRTAFLEHMRSHTGDRPFRCDQCTASFACVARLTVHRKSVHEPRQYKCDQCLKTFQTKHHLLRHAFIHTENKPFSCPYCKYSCNTQGNITKHVKSVHHKTDFSYRKHKSLMESKSCKIKPEWIEKGEKVTEQYLKDLSAKLGQDVTLDGLRTQLLQRQKITEKESEEAKMKRLSRVQRREHSYHAKKLSSSLKNEVSISNEDSGSSSVVVELDSNIMTFPVGESDGSIYQIVPSTDNMQFIHVQAESFTQSNDVHQSFNPLVLSSEGDDTELMKAHIYQMVDDDAIHLCVDGPIADPSTLQVNVKDSDDNKTLDMNRDEYLSDDVSLKDKENVDNTVVVIINTQNTSHS